MPKIISLGKLAEQSHGVALPAKYHLENLRLGVSTNVAPFRVYVQHVINGKSALVAPIWSESAILPHIPGGSRVVAQAISNGDSRGFYASLEAKGPFLIEKNGSRTEDVEIVIGFRDTLEGVQRACSNEQWRGNMTLSFECVPVKSEVVHASIHPFPQLKQQVKKKGGDS